MDLREEGERIAKIVFVSIWHSSAQQAFSHLNSFQFLSFIAHIYTHMSIYDMSENAFDTRVCNVNISYVALSLRLFSSASKYAEMFPSSEEKETICLN